MNRSSTLPTFKIGLLFGTLALLCSLLTLGSVRKDMSHKGLSQKQTSM